MAYEQRVKQIAMHVLFFGFFIGVFVLMHVVIALFLAGIVAQSKLTLALIILGANTILSTALIHWRRNMVTSVAYVIGSVWLGALFIGLLIFGPLLLLNKLLHLPGIVYIGLALVALVCAVGSYNARATVVRNITIKVSKKLERPVRIVQLSDVHMGEIYGPKFLKHVVDATNTLKPDVVAITGDLFDGIKVYDGMAESLQELNAPALYITGNHEIYGGVQEAVAHAGKYGAHLLDDTSVMIDGVHFVGVGYETQNAEAVLALHKDNDIPAVLLRHLPEHPEQAIAAGFDVQLSGHTHHGQMWPLNYLVKLQFPIMSGFYRKDNFTMYVSQGVGTWGPPFRIGSRSEITCITLEGS